MNNNNNNNNDDDDDDDNNNNNNNKINIYIVLIHPCSKHLERDIERL